MKDREKQLPYHFLVRTYVEHVTPHTKGKRTNWGAEWVKGTHVFGWQLMWAGAAVVVASWFHGELGWRVTLGAMGLLTAATGAWHRIYAQVICDLGLKRDSQRQEI